MIVDAIQVLIFVIHIQMEIVWKEIVIQVPVVVDGFGWRSAMGNAIKF